MWRCEVGAKESQVRVMAGIRCSGCSARLSLIYWQLFIGGSWSTEPRADNVQLDEKHGCS